MRVFISVLLIIVCYFAAISQTKQNTESAGRQLPPADDRESISGVVEYRIVLSSDNNNEKLPVTFRNWWFVRLDGVSSKQKTAIHIIGDGWEGERFVVPVFSYDKANWHRMSREDVVNDKPSDGYYNYTIYRQFDSASTVWVARYYPYTYEMLNRFIKKYEKHPFLKIENIGSTARGRQIKMLTITDPKSPDSGKKRIWIHARTHPSETASSFVVEGLVNFLLSDCNIHCRKVDLTKLIFNIVPMLNIDGVVAGNSRVTPDSSLDLERQWRRKSSENLYLNQDSAAREAKVINSAIVNLIDKGPEFIAAINLHAKNAFFEWRSFLYTNFTKSLTDHGEEGDDMFFRHLSFASILSKFYCGDTINVRQGYDPSVPMEKKPFPESWWWSNFRNNVMAVTLETTCGADGCFEQLVTYKDHLMLGEALALGLQKYYDYFIVKKWERYEAPITDMKKLVKFFKGGEVDEKFKQ